MRSSLYELLFGIRLANPLQLLGAFLPITLLIFKSVDADRLQEKTAEA